MTLSSFRPRAVEMIHGSFCTCQMLLQRQVYLIVLRENEIDENKGPQQSRISAPIKIGTFHTYSVETCADTIERTPN